MATRRSKEELIKALEEKLRKLKEDSAIKEIKITKDSAGMAEAVSAVENAATQNSTSIGEIIKTVSRLKRTGLKIENGTRKPRE